MIGALFEVLLNIAIGLTVICAIGFVAENMTPKRIRKATINIISGCAVVVFLGVIGAAMRRLW